MNVCFKCNKQITNDAKFCPYCGASNMNINNNQNFNNYQNTNYTQPMNNNQNFNNYQQVNNALVSMQQPVIKKGIKCKKCNQINEKKSKKCSNCGNNLKRQKRIKRLIKFGVFIGVIFLIFSIFSLFKEYKATEFDITVSGIEDNTSSKFYYVDEKLEHLEFKIKTLKSIKSVEVKVYANKLELNDFDLKGKRKVRVEDLTLINGLNTVEIVYHLKNKDVVKKINIYTTTDENLNGLNTNDTDGDGVLDYLEDVYGSNKELKDTDGDGLDDYIEINKTYTDPSNKYTYEDIIDTDYDFDGDGIANIIEVQNETNPLLMDTDNDGLDDLEEFSLGTNPLLMDTDNDGLDDYVEAKRFDTSPVIYNDTFSGYVSNDGVASIYLSNLTTDDINNVSIEKVEHYIINENFDGYIMSPYVFTPNRELDNLNISFDFSLYSDILEPTIYKIDIETNKLEEISTIIENKVAKAVITDYESPYVLFDKTELGNLINNFIANDMLNIDVNVPEGNQYLMLDVPLAKLIARLFGATTDKAVIYCYGECSENSMKRDEQVLNENSEEVELFEIKKVNYIFVKFIKLLQDWLDGFIMNLVPDAEPYQPILKDSRSSAKIYFYNVYIFDVYNIEDLETVLYGGYTGKLLGSNYMPIEVQDDKDTNKDGLSDAITQLIIAGKITTETGVNPLEGYTLEQINKNDDYDKDGIKNSDEIILKYDRGYYYLEMKSSPVSDDTDMDGLKDTVDPYPLYPFDSNFMIRDSLKGEPVNVQNLKKKVENFNSLFNKGKRTMSGIEYTDLDGNLKVSKNIYYMEYAMLRAGAEAGKVISLEDAARAEDRYFDATGEPYTEEDASDRLIKSPEIIYFLEDTIDDYKNLAYNAVANKQTLVFENRSPRTGANGGGTGNYGKKDILKVLNSVMFLHYASANSIGEITNKDGVYTLKLRYFVEDVYDWATEVVEGNDSTKVEVMYFNQLLLGNAKGFLVHIEYDVTVTFGKNIEDTYVIEAKPRYR